MITSQECKKVEKLKLVLSIEFQESAYKLTKTNMEDPQEPRKRKRRRRDSRMQESGKILLFKNNVYGDWNQHASNQRKFARTHKHRTPVH